MGEPALHTQPPTADTVSVVICSTIVTVYKMCSAGLQVDIVCGTPGRLEDLISTGNLDLSQIRFFILDEAVSAFNSSTISF